MIQTSVNHSPGCNYAMENLVKHHRELIIAADDNDPGRYRLALTNYWANFNVFKRLIYPECPGCQTVQNERQKVAEEIVARARKGDFDA